MNQEMSKKVYQVLESSMKKTKLVESDCECLEIQKSGKASVTGCLSLKGQPPNGCRNAISAAAPVELACGGQKKAMRLACEQEGDGEDRVLERRWRPDHGRSL